MFNNQTTGRTAPDRTQQRSERRGEMLPVPTDGLGTGESNHNKDKFPRPPGQAGEMLCSDALPLNKRSCERE